MSMIALPTTRRVEPVRGILLSALRDGWRSWRRRREARRALVAIARLSPRAIRDIGFEPEVLRAALGDGWEAALAPASEPPARIISWGTGR